MRLEKLTSLLGSLTFAVWYGFLEYYYKPWTEWMPLPKIRLYMFSEYSLFFMLPVIVFVAFYPFIDDLASKASLNSKLSTLLWGLGNTMLLTLIEDVSYFLPWRILYPIPGDPYGGLWIQPGEWTTKILGYITIMNVVIPVWYLILTPIIASFYLASVALLARGRSGDPDNNSRLRLGGGGLSGAIPKYRGA